MGCPKCGSKDWRMASVIHAAGLSTISVSTVGIGAGIDGDIVGGDVGLGGGAGITNGGHQTLLSKMAAPPTKKMHPAIVLIMAGIGVYAVTALIGMTTKIWENNGLDEPLVVISTLAFCVGLIYAAVSSEKIKKLDEEHKLALLQYEKKRMCLQCGAFFFENDTTESSRSVE